MTGWRIAGALALGLTGLGLTGLGLTGLAPWLGAWAAEAPGCAGPGDMVLHDMALPHARAAVAAGRALSILAVGGSTTAGTAAGGGEHSYTARLAARLAATLPGVNVRIATSAMAHRSARVMADQLDADIAASRPDIVIWGVGGLEAGRHQLIERFAGTLARGIDKAGAAGADVILMDVLYAPSIARVVDLTTYRDATATTAQAHGAMVLDRHDLMRRWSEAGVVDLDATDPGVRIGVARKLFDCFAAILADGITAAVRR